MPDLDPKELEALKKLRDEIFETAQTLAGLTTESLLSVTGAFLVLGLMGGGFFWLPFGGALLPALYRLYLLHEARPVRKLLAQLERYHHLIQAKERLWASTLPDSEKQRLGQALDQLLLAEAEAVAKAKKQFEP